MTIAKVWIGLVACAVIFMCVSIGLLALDLRRGAQAITLAGKDADATIVDARRNLMQKGGILDITKATMMHVDRAAGEAAIASRQQRVYWDQLGAKSVTTLAQAQHTLETLDRTIDGIGKDAHSTSESANAAIAGIRPVLAQARIDLDSLDAGIKGLRPIEDNIQSVTASGAQIGRTVAVKVDSLAHPTRTQRIVGGILTALRGASYLGWLVK